jgi:hypothetical protein
MCTTISAPSTIISEWCAPHVACTRASTVTSSACTVVMFSGLGAHRAATTGCHTFRLPQHAADRYRLYHLPISRRPWDFDTTEVVRCSVVQSRPALCCPPGAAEQRR